jgi:hypothetical protein
MDQASGRRKEEDGYRKGVLLGLTVAEIITLILFALLLALWGQISKLQGEIERAKAINAKFYKLVNSAQSKSNLDLAIELEKIIKAEIDYAARLAAELERYKSNLLPDEIFELIKSQSFDLRKVEDREKFFALTKMATQLAKEANQSPEKMASTCAAGAEAVEKFKGADPGRVWSDLNHWKGVAASCGKGNSLPPCYVVDGREALIFEARLKDNGILLKDTVPIELREQFVRDFPSPPTFEIVLDRQQFRQQTAQFLQHSRINKCSKFRVNAFDDTGQDKRNFQEIEQVLDGVFFKRKNW